MELGQQKRKARGRHSDLQLKSGHMVSDQGGISQTQKYYHCMCSLPHTTARISQSYIQVTGEEKRYSSAQQSWSDADQTSLEFEIATLAGDGSGFSGDKAPLPLWSRLCHREGCEVPRKHLREQGGDQPGDLRPSLLQEANMHPLDAQPRHNSRSQILDENL